MNQMEGIHNSRWKKSVSLIIVACVLLYGCIYMYNSKNEVISKNIDDAEDEILIESVSISSQKDAASIKIPLKILFDYDELDENGTLKFCAEELKNHLEQGLNQPIEVHDITKGIERGLILIKLNSSRDNDYLECSVDELERKLGEQGFMIIPKGSNVLIVSKSEIGLLYGGYSFLEKLGYNWITQNRTNIPNLDVDKIYNLSEIIENPEVTYRGFWNYKEPSIKFIKWAVRNKMNLIGDVDGRIADKYGINIWVGGHHLLHESLHDEKLFIENPELYGLKNGMRRYVSEDETIYINPCLSNDDFLDIFYVYLYNKYNLMDYSGKLIVNIWPSDVSSASYFCDCYKCKRIGNSTDNLMYFYQRLVEKIEKNSDTKFDLVINGISYYSTWKLPNENYKIDDKHFVQSLYMNQRSFSKNIIQDTLNDRVVDWFDYAKNNAMKLGIIEYYNFSVYGGVLSDYNSILYKDMDFYIRNNVDLVAYMHPLEGDNGTFDLLNYSLSKVLWGGENTQQKIEKIYFQSLYPVHKDKIKKIYKNIDYALSNRKEILGENSLKICLLQEVFWTNPVYSEDEIKDNLFKYLDGGKQKLPARFQSLLDYQNAEFIGLIDSISLLKESLNDLEVIYKSEHSTLENKKIANDIEWVKASLSIYELLYELTMLRLELYDYTSPDYGDSINKIVDEVIFLKNNPVFFKTISDVNQLNLLSHLWSENIIIPKELRIKLREVKSNN